MNHRYKRHLIRLAAYPIPNTRHWTWKATITHQDDPTSMQELDGASEKHPSQEEAEKAAIPVVRKWIDHGKPRLN
jgi:hypothetical protein